MKAILKRGAGAILGLVLIFALLITSMLVLPARALERGDCLSFPAITEKLADQFGEQVFFWGEVREGLRVLVAASANGTWTMFGVVEETGEACVFFFGDRWTGDALPAQGEEH